MVDPARSFRLPGYDLARALAVMGMVLVNFAAMMEVGVYIPAWLKPAVDFIYGRAAVVFVMLAGLSISMMSRAHRRPEAFRALQRRLLRRCLLLMMAGIVLWHWWDADILHFYAVYIAVGVWAASWRHDHLWRLTVIIFCISMPVSASLTTAVDLGDTLFPVDPGRPELTLLVDILTSPYYAIFPWLGFFLAGMLLGRLEPAAPSYYRRLCLAGTAVCVTVEMISAALLKRLDIGGFDIEGDWWIAFLRSEAFPVTPMFILSAGASAVALIGLCRSMDDRMLRNNRTLAAVTAFGRLSLTMYIAHIGWGLVIKHWLPPASSGFTSHELLLSVAAFNLVGIWFAAWWCRYFRRGPLETIFHRLCRGKVLDGALQTDRV